MKPRKKTAKFKKMIDDIIFYSIIIGIFLLSIGIYLIGSGNNPPLGKNLIVIGSSMFYISMIVFVFRL